MRRIITLLTIYCTILNINQAQEIEAGVFLGVSNYQGDLMFYNFEAQEQNIAFGLFARYRMNEFLSFKAAFTKGTLSGDDSWAPPTSGRKERNLSFESDISELSLTVEFNPFPFITDELEFISVYGFTGIAGFHFNPKTFYDGTWIDLQPMDTENLGTDIYGLYQIAIPAGVGGSIRINDVTSLGMEIGIRKTFTDYLDDVSGNYPDVEKIGETDPVRAALAYRTPEYLGSTELTNPYGTARGNPNKKDWYMFAGLNFTVNVSNLFALGGGPGIYSPF